MKGRPTPKWLALIVAVIAGMTIGGIEFSGSAAGAGNVRSPLVVVERQTGPALSNQLLERVAQENAAQAGDAGASMALGEGTLQEAMRSIDSSARFPEAEGGHEASPAVQAMLGESVALVVLRGRFTLQNAHVQKGDLAPSGTVLDLVIDAHSGAVVGRALPLRQEVPIEGGSSTLASAFSRGRIIVHPVLVVHKSRKGTLAARVVLAGGPLHHRQHEGPRPRNGSAAGYHVLVKRGSRVVRGATTSTNGFRVRLRPGRYRLEISGSHPGRCGVRNALVRSGKTTHAVIVCSIR